MVFMLECGVLMQKYSTSQGFYEDVWL